MSGSYNQARGSGINTGSATRFTVTGLQGGRTYYFAVTAGTYPWASLYYW